MCLTQERMREDPNVAGEEEVREGLGESRWRTLAALGRWSAGRAKPERQRMDLSKKV